MEKTLHVITAGIVLLGGVYVLLLATAPAKKWHQVWTQVAFLETDDTPARKEAEYERIVQMLSAWAGRVGLERVPPERVDSICRHWVASFSEPVPGAAQIFYLVPVDPPGWIAYFCETKSHDPSWPIAVIVALNPPEYAVIDIFLVEGYQRRPSPRGRGLQALLWKQLQECYRSRLISKPPRKKYFFEESNTKDSACSRSRSGDSGVRA